MFLVAGAALLVYIFWAPRWNTDTYLNHRIPEEQAVQIANEYLHHIGYPSEGLYYSAQVVRRAEIINDLQNLVGKEAFINNALPKPYLALGPYYYELKWFTSDSLRMDPAVTIDHRRVSLQQTRGLNPAYRMIIDTQGNVLEFEADAGANLTTVRMDSLAKEPLEFSQLARYYLQPTFWNTYPLQTDTLILSVERESKVKYQVPDTLYRWNVGVELAIAPNGALTGITATYTRIVDRIQLTDQIILDLIRGIIIAILVIIFLVVLVRRLDARLIDMKFALIDGIIAGLLVDIFVVLGYLHNNPIAPHQTDRLFELLLLIIASGAAAALLTFVISGASESLSRASGMKTFKALDLLKQGFFFNKVVGFSITRGVSFGVILAGMLFIPLGFTNLHLHYDQAVVFHSDQVLWPSLELIARSGFWSMILMYLIFLGVGGLSWNLRQNWYLFGAFVVFAGIILEITGLSLDPIYGNVLLGGSVALAMVFIYRYFGIATVVFTHFVYSMMLVMVNGWSIEGSPDMGSSILLGLVILLLFAFGIAAATTGQETDEIPEYTPTYVAELSGRERMVRELEIAHSVQLSFLPRSTPVIPHFEIGAQCRPAMDTGGDFYDIIDLRDGRYGIIIGDVSGKGIQAAFYMTLIKGFIQSLCERIASPAELLMEINRLFLRNADRGIFVTILYGILDAQTGEFTFARAGHSPFIFKPGPETHPRHVRTQGVGIGIVDDERFNGIIQLSRIQVPEDGFICFYTDGITEAMNLKREMYGDHRLLARLSEITDEHPDQIIQLISDDMARFVGRAPQHDDTTLVVIRRKVSTTIPGVS